MHNQDAAEICHIMQLPSYAAAVTYIPRQQGQMHNQDAAEIRHMTLLSSYVVIVTQCGRWDRYQAAAEPTVTTLTPPYAVIATLSTGQAVVEVRDLTALPIYVAIASFYPSQEQWEPAVAAKHLIRLPTYAVKD